MARPRTPRSDASQNRAKILDNAKSALALSSDVTMQAIARSAGVGQGTLYRHFPTREALLLEVHRRDVQALVDSAPALLLTTAPFGALRAWLGQLAEYGRIKHGLLDAVYAPLHRQLDHEGRGRVVSAIQLLLRAGQRDGVFRSDVRAPDVLLLVSFLWRLDTTHVAPAQTDHLLDLVLDGLRPTS